MRSSRAAPCDINEGYGYLWWLNTGGAHFSQAPDTSFFAIGAGQNTIWIEPAHKFVAVIRWADDAKMNDLVGHIMTAMG